MAKATAAASKQVTESKAETVPEWDKIVGLRKSNIADLATEHDEIDRQIKRLELRKKEIKELGVKLLIKADIKSVMVGELIVTRQDGVSSKLNKPKLVKLHGTKVLDWLKECTDQTPYTTLRVTAPKEEGDGEEE